MTTVTGWVVQRKIDSQYYTGIYRATWSGHVSAARAFISKKAAVREMRDKGFRLEALWFEELPVPKPRTKYVPVDV